jgi:hypothetical protein
VIALAAYDILRDLARGGAACDPLLPPGSFDDGFNVAAGSSLPANATGAASYRVARTGDAMNVANATPSSTDAAAPVKTAGRDWTVARTAKTVPDPDGELAARKDIAIYDPPAKPSRAAALSAQDPPVAPARPALSQPAQAFRAEPPPARAAAFEPPPPAPAAAPPAKLAEPVRKEKKPVAVAQIDPAAPIEKPRKAEAPRKPADPQPQKAATETSEAKATALGSRKWIGGAVPALDADLSKGFSTGI